MTKSKKDFPALRSINPELLQAIEKCLVMTNGVAMHFENDQFAEFLAQSLARYTYEDWGDCDDEDKKTNDTALKEGNRLVAVYNIPAEIKLKDCYDSKIYIITEWDRSVTTILFPSEY